MISKIPMPCHIQEVDATIGLICIVASGCNAVCHCLAGDFEPLAERVIPGLDLAGDPETEPDR